jgi:16S rRNA A1518/A1519 N6-dimethyltransferase RsmA/KsgA/DIM1 with predicted DNA glycosylase/AP lyase activity
VTTVRSPSLRNAAAWPVRSSLELLSDLYNYNHWIYNKVRPFIRGRVCEVGSGVGNVTQFMLNNPQLVGIEPCADSFEETRTRFQEHLNVRLVRCGLEDCP